MVRHLYIHVPFCQRRCSYCDFSIAVRKQVPGSEYVHAVLQELDLVRTSPGWANPGAQPRGPEATGTHAAQPRGPEATRIQAAQPRGPEATRTQAAQPRGPEATGTHAAQPRGPEATGTHAAQPRGPEATGTQAAQPRGPEATALHTLYLGGGTPSLLPAPDLTRLLTSLFDAFSSTQSLDDVEVTLEANPEDVTDASVRTWRSAGVNRVSLGAQSFDDRVLKWMHRSHDAARIGDAVRTLRAAGIENISLDLIFALPEDLQRDWGRDLDHALALRPTHMSLYGLTVEPRTPLDRWISRGATKLPADDGYAEEYLLAHQRLTANGFQFYEVSNAARDGHRSRHNSAYWSGRPYVGLGPAAHSFDGRTRRWNIAAWEAYRRAIAEGRSAVESEEVLTEEQRKMEGMYLALRTDAGLPRDALTRLSTPLDAWLRAGWVVEEGTSLRCTPQGWLRLDALVAKLFVAKELAS